MYICVLCMCVYKILCIYVYMCVHLSKCIYISIYICIHTNKSHGLKLWNFEFKELLLLILFLTVFLNNIVLFSQILFYSECMYLFMVQKI